MDNGYYTITTDYHYENGVLKTMVENYVPKYGMSYTTTYTYTCDDQGRPVHAVIDTTNPNNTYKAQEMLYTYQDLYFFDNTGLMEEE